ncbi:MAG TPA: hypothetical protein VGP72_09120 [Planctomycetota bacterium]|jgi:hypothetical protein
MTITLESVDDQTPKGLTTGFRLRLNCSTAEGKKFVLGVVVLVSKSVLEKMIPLPNLVIAALERWGFEEGSAAEIFVDSRRLNLDGLSSVPSAFPKTVTLGGVEMLNQKALAKLGG